MTRAASTPTATQAAPAAHPAAGRGAALAGYAVTLLVVAYSMALRFNHFQGASWDNGVFLLDGWRTLLGQVPNVDYVSGYPGGFEYLLALAFRLAGLNFAATHWLMAALSLLAATVTYFGLRRHFAPLGACAGACFVFYLYAWLSEPSPGMVAQLFLLATLLVLGRPQFNPDVRTLALLAALGGFCLYFKQTGIVSLTGVALALGFDAVLRGTGSRRAAVLTALPHALPFAAFLAARAAPHIPLRTYLSFYPWLLLLALLLGMALAARPIASGARRGAPRRHYRELALVTAVAALSIVPWLAFYAWTAPSLPGVLYEMYIHIPRLLGANVYPPDLRAPFLVAAALLLLPFLPRSAAAAVRARSQLLARRIGMRGALALLALGLAAAVASVHALFDLPTVLRYLGFIAFFVMFVLGGFAVPTWVAAARLRKRDALDAPAGRAVARVSAYLSVITVTAFPWSPSAGYVVATLFLGYLLVCAQWAFPQRWGLAAATVRRVARAFPIAVLLLIVFGFHHDRLAHRDGERRIVTGLPPVEGMLDHDTIRRFVELAREIDRRIPPDEALVTFPTLAFSNFAAGRMQASRQGNYFGDAGPDLQAFFAELEQRQVPWFILAPTYYPLFVGYPILPPLEKVQALLTQHYRLEHTFDGFEFWQRLGDGPLADPAHPAVP